MCHFEFLHFVHETFTDSLEIQIDFLIDCVPFRKFLINLQVIRKRLRKTKRLEPLTSGVQCFVSVLI